jgi:hypothetical protein
MQLDSIEVDWSLVIAIAALLVSVLSPTITAIVKQFSCPKNAGARVSIKPIGYLQSSPTSGPLENARGNGIMENFGEYGERLGENLSVCP